MKCARTACNNQDAICRHTQTGRMYCSSCARKINKFNPGLVEMPTNGENFWRQADGAARSMKRLHDSLIADGFKPMGGGALADCYVKDVPGGRAIQMSAETGDNIVLQRFLKIHYDL